MANNGCQHGQPVVQALADPWALGHLGGTGPAVPGPSKDSLVGTSPLGATIFCRLPATSTPLVHQPTPQRSTSGTRRANSSSPAYTQNLSATLQLQPAGIS
ncbi:hypothetical protein OEZ85_007870 [Tetradesmus obliquus]|uniref:Uncharacterized protein n=1 Tax=Tetradesmus obliquus TaxID=3088 RepID=A0ABY8TLS7_TETOB|nr:hypothetical protein OEZ85_007870 [Tetradesmus obliquus]